MNDLFKIKITQKYKKNWERLSAIVSEDEHVRSSILEEITKFFKSSIGQDMINSYILKNEDKYLEVLKLSRGEEIEKSIQIVLTQLNNLEQQKQKLKEKQNSLIQSKSKFIFCF